MCDFFFGVNNNRPCIIALQYFLLSKQITFTYNCQIDGDIFNPISIHCYKYEELTK